MQPGAPDRVGALASADVPSPEESVGPPSVGAEAIAAEQTVLDPDPDRALVGPRDLRLTEVPPALVRDDRPGFSAIPSDGDCALGSVIAIRVKEEPNRA